VAAADSALIVVDLHTHTYHSDGELGPSEFMRRAEVAGLSGVVLTDHVDASNVERIVKENGRAVASERTHGVLMCAVGCELTHVRPGEIAHLVQRARGLGAEFVVVHGESPVEPVAAGTNRAAIEAGCDLLAHPGQITEDDAKLAAERGVLLEISGKPGHSLANGHVAATAARAGALVVYGGDSHRVGDIRSPEGARNVLLHAGLSGSDADAALARGVEALRRASQAGGA
jgi:histidinol phosphatase-like PHP family hydrolase